MMWIKLSKQVPSPLPFIGTTVHDNFDKIKIVINRLDFSVLIAPQNDAKLVVSRQVILNAISVKDPAIY